MNRELPALLSLVGLLVILGIWYVFLFVTQPEGLGTFEAVWRQAASALNPSSPESAFFIGSLVSSLLCGSIATLFLARKPKFAIGLAVLNTVIAVFLFSPMLVIALALPLLFAGKFWKNA